MAKSSSVIAQQCRQQLAKRLATGEND